MFLGLRWQSKAGPAMRCDRLRAQDGGGEMAIAVFARQAYVCRP